LLRIHNGSNNDITDTALLIFIRGIDSAFHAHVELANLCSLKGTSAGEDLFLKVKQTLVSMELGWGKLTSVTTDCGRSFMAPRPAQ
jgi:hypothetical protein